MSFNCYYKQYWQAKSPIAIVCQQPLLGVCCRLIILQYQSVVDFTELSNSGNVPITPLGVLFDPLYEYILVLFQVGHKVTERNLIILSNVYLSLHLMVVIMFAFQPVLC